MITLEIPPQQQAIIEQASKQAGMSINSFILQNAYEKAMQSLGKSQGNAELDGIFGRYNHHAKGNTSIEQMNESIGKAISEKWTHIS